MEPVLLVLVSGIVGGTIWALLSRRIQRASRDEIAAVASARTDDVAPPVINMARIKVDGIGGLGLVLACLTIAIAVPAVGRSVLMGAVLGVGLAAWLILRRRRQPLPSHGAGPGAHSMLSMDSTGRAGDDRPSHPESTRSVAPLVDATRAIAARA